MCQLSAEVRTSMDTCPHDALLGYGKALLCVIIILILLVTVSTSLAFCQYFQSQNIIRRLSTLELKADINNTSSHEPSHIHHLRKDLIHYVNEKN